MMHKFFIFLVGISLLLSSCNQRGGTSNSQPQDSTVESNLQNDSHNSSNSLDWEGTYIGILPCADCEGVKTSLKLNRDHSFQIKNQFIGKNNKIFEQKGVFRWNNAGNSIILDSMNGSPNQYFVGENTLMQLDKDGKKISGDFPERYILKKIDVDKEKLTEKYWKLTELMGTAIADKSDGSKEIHLVFDAMNQNVNGFAGCNNFFGSYELEEGNKLSFSKVAATKMACLDVTVEDDFFKMLGMVDNYSISDSTLLLQQSTMAPSAKFKLVEKK